MKYYRQSITVLFFIMAASGLMAQGKTSCDSLLHKAHAKLGNLYSPSVGEEGYAFRLAINTTYREQVVTKVNPQQIHMMVSGKTFVFESEQIDSYQNDSLRISVIKGQNRVYISSPDNGNAVSYMEQFNAIQKEFTRFVSIDQCHKKDGKIHIRATVRQDTLGLDMVKAVSYIIDGKTNDINQILFQFPDDNEISTYTIVYSDVVRPYALSKSVSDRYLQMAHRAAAGEKKFEQYSLIDNRKKNNP